MRSAFAAMLLVLSGCEDSTEETGPIKSVSQLTSGAVHRKAIHVPAIGEVLCAVSVSGSYREKTAAPLVLLLHYGYRGPKPPRFTGAAITKLFRRSLDQFGAITIAPDAVGGNWTDAKNEEAALFLVRSAMDTYNIDPEKVIVAGYSMGGQGAWHIGSRHQDLFTGAIPMAGRATGTEKWKIPVVAVHSRDDEVVPYDQARAHLDAVRAAGGDAEFIDAPGCTHFQMRSYGTYFAQALRAVAAKWAAAETDSTP